MDGLRLQQLLANLVVNAIKYGAPDMPVQVVVTDQEVQLYFEVRNSGPAIEHSTLEQMFDPLKRDPKRGGRYDEGSSLGLGLYIAREITTAHGGRIEARSDKMETVFAVYLPRHQQPA